MTVEELEREFIIGQKWAVEIYKYIEKDGFEVLDEIITNHYEVGRPSGRIRCFKNEIRYIRVVQDEIYCVVKENL